ncbi:MAG: DUF6265 family protein [Planctomycetota bacterium]|nr:DUF6265 family protein [Planctomycetota bacterium]
MLRARNAFLLLPLLLTPASDSGPTGSMALDDLAWLNGTWRSEAEDGSFMEETWSAARGDAMCGMLRNAGAHGAVNLYELMSIELDGPALPQTDADGPIIPGQARGGAPQRLVLRVRHFNRGLDPWKSEAEAPLTMQVVSVTENQFLLEAPEREFPRTASYTREGDTLTVQLKAAQETGRQLKFSLKRVSQ